VQQARQHTLVLVDDVAAAPVIDVGTFDRATDHVVAGCVLRHAFGAGGLRS
jgi:hypothetical protein